jgi:hypothetical protein
MAHSNNNFNIIHLISCSITPSHPTKTIKKISITTDRIIIEKGHRKGKVTAACKSVIAALETVIRKEK